jgi:hypothetical protein
MLCPVLGARRWRSSAASAGRGGAGGAALDQFGGELDVQGVDSVALQETDEQAYG